MVGGLLGKPSKNSPPKRHGGTAGDHAVGNTPCAPHVEVEGEEGDVFLRNQGSGSPTEKERGHEPSLFLPEKKGRWQGTSCQNAEIFLSLAGNSFSGHCKKSFSLLIPNPYDSHNTDYFA